MMASAVFLIRQNTNRTRQIAACKRTLRVFLNSLGTPAFYPGAGPLPPSPPPPHTPPPTRLFTQAQFFFAKKKKEPAKNRVNPPPPPLSYLDSIVSFTFSRGLLDDENFHADIESLAEEPIPYFRQFQTVDATRLTSSVGFDDEMDLDVVYPSLKVWKTCSSLTIIGACSDK